MRPAILLICAWWVAASGAEPAAVAPEKPAPIAVVKTLAELLAQPGVKAKNDQGRQVSVRLGIEARSANAGSGLLMYAVADNAAIAQGTDDDLGPVVIMIQREGAEEHIDSVHRLQRQWPEAPLYLFLKSIPLPTSGRYHVKAFSPDRKQILGQTTIEVTERPADDPCWRELVTESLRGLQGTDGIPWLGSFSIGAKALPKFVGEDAVPLMEADTDGKVEGAGKIALPTLLPPPLAPETDSPPDADMARQIAVLIQRLSHEAYEEREAATRELARLGQRAEASLQHAFQKGDDPEIRNRAWYLLRALDGPFTVRLVEGKLHLEMAIPFDPASMEEHLLARWWVNGKPLHNKAAADQMRNGSGQVVAVCQAELTIDLSDLKLKATDSVEVEFLYCPKGTELIAEDTMLAQAATELEDPRAGDLFQSVRCLRSNRLKFVAAELKQDAR